MTALLNAIATKAGTLSATFPGGYHRDRAPEGTTSQPYIVATLIATPSRPVYGAGNRMSEIHVRLSAIGIGHNATATACETMNAAFDDSILTLTAGTNYEAIRLSDPLGTLYAPVDGNGDEWWQWSCEYRFSVRS